MYIYLINFCFSKVLFTSYFCVCARANCMHMLTHMYIYIEISSTQHPDLLQKKHTHTHTHINQHQGQERDNRQHQKLPQCLLPTTNPIFSGGTHSTITPTQILLVIQLYKEYMQEYSCIRIHNFTRGFLHSRFSLGGPFMWSGVPFIHSLCCSMMYRYTGAPVCSYPFYCCKQ